ncbi:MAG TPA: bifunctional methylenetetrahydrofolate dehydrogenase/methenyltetrahydrofolate cyclohydrolase FolD [Deltaproteobacteria bacterium]|nr:bifunctional methylenetetrahydrofolate dehydrogenase/methenyltetrahydrofolate cyclohydrolase FolD [Deltaproteobacteria bacterium]
MGIIIDGKELSRKKREEISRQAGEFSRAHGRPPGLAVVLVGQDPASAIYVRNKKAGCEQCGIRSFEHLLPESTTQKELLALIDTLNDEDAVDGILVQLPLPSHLQEREVLLRIDPAKDVDGFHPYSMGRLLMGEPTLVPCTPRGIMYMLDEHGIDPKGKDAVIIGRSNIVGKPAALLLMMRHATITICHSRTLNLDRKVASADIVVAAIGRPEFIRGEWIKEGAVGIEVGMNRTEAGLKGDVEFEGAKRRASLITPVPGGVGPMTITMLLDNTLIAARARVS